ncbi:hypothetical protein VTP01DRAFT_5960 [Rhizomucor pusillus]|uniref:uncharacterized protein n=1 Tax=Rhizomucor pusillus TaxID=4840 RepID=UPI0037420FD5
MYASDREWLEQIYVQRQQQRMVVIYEVHAQTEAISVKPDTIGAAGMSQASISIAARTLPLRRPLSLNYVYLFCPDERRSVISTVSSISKDCMIVLGDDSDSQCAPAVDDSGKRTMYRRAQYLFMQWALQHDVDINHFSSADLINFSADTYADLYSCNTLHIFRSAILHLQQFKRSTQPHPLFRPTVDLSRSLQYIAVIRSAITTHLCDLNVKTASCSRGYLSSTIRPALYRHEC